IFRANCSQASACSPIPSKLPGRVRGFQTPARKTCTLPVLLRLQAASTTCDSDSALQGPAMYKGRTADNKLVFVFNCVFILRLEDNIYVWAGLFPGKAWSNIL